MDLKDKKVLIVYFSRKGQNYSNGKIIDLPIGNTELVSKMTAVKSYFRFVLMKVVVWGLVRKI